MILALALIVILPADTHPVALDEARRLQPEVRFVATALPIEPAASLRYVVAYVQLSIGHNRYAPHQLGTTRLDCSCITVHLGVVRTLVGGGKRFQVALGRVIAHEVEHVLRRDAEHAPSGWFARELGRAELTGKAEPLKKDGVATNGS